MIKAKIKRCMGKVKLKGKIPDILTELTILTNDVLEHMSLCDSDYDVFKKTFIDALNHIDNFKGGVKSDRENKTDD